MQIGWIYTQNTIIRVLLIGIGGKIKNMEKEKEKVITFHVGYEASIILHNLFENLDTS